MSTPKAKKSQEDTREATQNFMEVLLQVQSELGYYMRSNEILAKVGFDIVQRGDLSRDELYHMRQLLVLLHGLAKDHTALQTERDAHALTKAQLNGMREVLSALKHGYMG